MSRPPREGYNVVLTNHVFDEVRSIDMTLREFEALVGGGRVIEESLWRRASRNSCSSSTGRDPSTWSRLWMTFAKKRVS
jgi:hypothetical protein